MRRGPPPLAARRGSPYGPTSRPAPRSRVMTTLPDSDALLTDAEIVRIRQAEPTDVGAVLTLHQRLSARTIYLRYFSAAPNVERYVRHLLRAPDCDHTTLLGLLKGEVVAVAGYERLAHPEIAEVAFLVDDQHQGLGIGTLMLEHLAAAATSEGIRTFVAETLPDNVAMLTVFRDAGYALNTRYEDGQVSVEFPVRPDERAQAAADRREGLAEFRSLDQLLRPLSVTVVGAGGAVTGLGHQLLANVIAGGYRGPVH